MLVPESMRTERLVLRPLREEDLGDLMRFFGHKECCAFLAPGIVYQVLVQGHMPHILAQWITSYHVEEDASSMVGVTERGHDPLAGFVGLEKRAIDDSPRLVYCIMREQWGKGYATEAAGRMLRFVLEQTAWARVEALVDPRNQASVRVAEKLGMRYERMVHDAEFPDDQRLYAIDREGRPGADKD